MGAGEIRGGTIPGESFVWLLATLHRLAGRPFDAALFLKQFPPPYDTVVLLAALDGAGFRAGEAAADRDKLRALPLPAIGFLREGEGAVPALIVKADAERFLYFRAGSNEAQTAPLEDFEARFHPAVLLVSPPEPAEDAIEGFESEGKAFGFRWFVPEILKHRAIWRDVLVASAAIMVIGLATPLFTQVIIDKVVVHQTMSTLLVIGAALGIFLVFNAVMSWMRQYLVIHTGNRVDSVLATSVLGHLFRLPVPYFERRPTGVTVARLHGVETIREFITGAAVSFVLDLPFLVIVLAVMFWYSWQLSLIALGIVLLLALVSLLVTPVLRERLNKQFMLGARNQAFLTEYVSGVETVKTLQFEPVLERKYGDFLAQYLASTFSARNLSNSYNVVAGALEQLMTLAILIVGALLVMRNDGFTIGMLVAFQMFAARMAQPMMRIAGLWQEFQQASIAARRLGDILDAPTEPQTLAPSRAGGGRRPHRGAGPQLPLQRAAPLPLPQPQLQRAARRAGARRRALGLRQEHPRQAPPRLLPAERRPHPRRRPRPRPPRGERAAPGLRRRPPGDHALLRHDLRQPLDGEPARQLRGHRHRLPCGRDPRRHREAPPGLPDPHRRARHRPLRRPEAARRHRPRPPQETEDPHLRRSHQQPRPPDRRALRAHRQPAQGRGDDLLHRSPGATGIEGGSGPAVRTALRSGWRQSEPKFTREMMAFMGRYRTATVVGTLLSCLAVAALGSPVVESDLQADAISPVFWMSPDVVMFHGPTGEVERRPDGSVRQINRITTWNFRTREVRRHERLAGALCYADGNVAFGEINPHNTQEGWTSVGRLGAMRRLEGPVRIDRMTCLPESVLPALQDSTKDRWIVRLRPEHGFIDLGPQGEMQNTPIHFYPRNAGPGIELPIRRREFRPGSVRFYDFKGAYFFERTHFDEARGHNVSPWPAGVARTGWWLFPDGRVEEVRIPFGSIGRDGLTPTSRGILGVNNAFFSISGAQPTDGVYLLTDSAATRLVTGVTADRAIAVDGCRAALRRQAEPGKRKPDFWTITVLDLCEGS